MLLLFYFKNGVAIYN